MNGGYAMIDCTGLDLTKGSTPQTIDGLYDSLQVALEHGKPVIAYNCEWNENGVDRLMSPISVMVVQYSENLIVATASTLQVFVGSDDSVTINNLVG